MPDAPQGGARPAVFIPLNGLCGIEGKGRPSIDTLIRITTLKGAGQDDPRAGRGDT